MNVTYTRSNFTANLVASMQASEAKYNTKRGKKPKSLGAYYNYCDPELGNHKQSGVQYWGAEGYEKLSVIKGKWDPRGVFENPQSIKGKRGW